MTEFEAALVTAEGDLIWGGKLDADGAVRWPPLELEKPCVVTHVILPGGEMIPLSTERVLEEGDIVSFPPGSFIE